MPILLISTQFRLGRGPTTVGDSNSDAELMRFLDAEYVQELGNDFGEYKSKLRPRLILDRLETIGYHVIGMAGIGQTCCWTLQGPDVNHPDTRTLLRSLIPQQRTND